MVLLVGAFLTSVTLGGDTPSAIAHHAALGMGLSLTAAVAIEVRRSRSNVMRADLVCMVALYYLLFLEFLFPQPNLDVIARNYEIEVAIHVALWSWMAMAVGRHCVSSRVKRWRAIDLYLPSSSIMLLFWGCFVIGYFHMLMAVDFNPLEMVRYFIAPRFSAPWQRGRFGDASALLYELGATIYLVPPLAGIVLGRRHLHSRMRLAAVLLGLLLTLFYGFTSGTRSIIGAYVITFMVAYYYASDRSPRRLIALAIVGASIMVASTIYSLEFRQIGLSAYLAQGTPSDRPQQAFFVDYNLYTISQLITVFPRRVPFLGWEVPSWVLVRVVPRVLWPGKPDGVSISPETYLDVAGETTLSATFIGEGYMCAGVWGAIVTGFALGGLATWWTRKTFSTRSDFGILLYGSGFFAIVITMRSLYMLPVAILPTLAVAMAGSFLVRSPARAALPVPQRRV